MHDLDRFLHLDDEVRSVGALLDRADGLIAEFKFADRDRHVIEALLALGIEKMAKLTYGLAHESVTGNWPGPEIRQFGHGITRAHDACVKWVTDHIATTTNSGVVESALRSLETDPFASRLLLHLENYAYSDRYFNLNRLAGKSDDSQSPKAFWANMEHEVWEMELSGRSPLTNELIDEWERHRVMYLQRSVLRLWAFYFQAWIQGACGPTAKQHGHDLRGVTPLLVDEI